MWFSAFIYVNLFILFDGFFLYLPLAPIKYATPTRVCFCVCVCVCVCSFGCWIVMLTVQHRIYELCVELLNCNANNEQCQCSDDGKSLILRALIRFKKLQYVWVWSMCLCVIVSYDSQQRTELGWIFQRDRERERGNRTFSAWPILTLAKIPNFKWKMPRKTKFLIVLEHINSIFPAIQF